MNPKKLLESKEMWVILANCPSWDSWDLLSLYVIRSLTSLRVLTRSGRISCLASSQLGRAAHANYTQTWHNHTKTKSLNPKGLQIQDASKNSAWYRMLHSPGLQTSWLTLVDTEGMSARLKCQQQRATCPRIALPGRHRCHRCFSQEEIADFAYREGLLT